MTFEPIHIRSFIGGPGPVVLPSTTTSSTTTKAVTTVTSISPQTVTLTTSLVNPSISSVSTPSVQIPVPTSISSGPTPISSSPISISSSPVSISSSSISAPASTSSASTSSFVVSASSVSAQSSSRLLPLGAIIGAPLAALALLVLIIVFLLFKLKRRRETLLKVEVDPPVVSVTPFESGIRERPQGDHVSMATTPTGTHVTPLAPNSITSDGFTSYTSPTSPGKYGARTPGTLATTSSSDLNPNPDSSRLGHFQSNISNNDFNATRAPLTLSYVSNSTDIYDDTLDSAPPAYDSLTNRVAHINSTQLKS